MRPLYAVLILAVTWNFPASAAANDGLEHLCTDNSGCVCPADLPKLKLPPLAPKGLLLVAACSVRKEGTDILGNFFYKGEAVIAGKIRRALEWNDMFGDQEVVTFADLRFMEEHRTRAIEEFKLPSLSGKARCWVADAQVKIRSVRVDYGPGTDQDGSFVDEFDVLTVGPFRRCRSMEDPPQGLKTYKRQ